VVVVSDTSITCVAPAGSGDATIVVTGATADAVSVETVTFTYNPAPEVHALSPQSGLRAGGTAVTVYGANFLAGATVSFGGVAATSVVVTSASVITCVAPAGTGSANVTVTAGGQTSTDTVTYSYLGTTSAATYPDDMLATAESELDSVMATYNSRTVSYTRSGVSVALVATVGKTIFRQDDAEGFQTRYETRDYIVAVADLSLSGALVTPQAGDQIVEVDGNITLTYEVLQPGDEPCYRYEGTARLSYRIHCKLVGVST